jgi:hypothetical protein
MGQRGTERRRVHSHRQPAIVFHSQTLFFYATPNALQHRAGKRAQSFANLVQVKCLLLKEGGWGSA